MRDVIAGLHRLEREVLPALQKHSSVHEIVKSTGMQEVEVIRALKWLSEKKLCSIKEDSIDVIELDKNGEEYLGKGLPERRFLEALDQGRLDMQSLAKVAGLSREEINVSIGALKRNNWISISQGPSFEITDDGKKKLSEGFEEEEFLKKVPARVSDLGSKEKSLLQSMSSRKSILKTITKKRITATLTSEGRKAAASKLLGKKVEGRITAEMLKSGSWEKVNLRGYNIKASVPKIFIGKKQPYRRFLEEVRAKLVALGFREMDGPVVESEFWNMDALFMPQFHSARDIHDAYYVKDPRFAKDLPNDLLRRVKSAHENGVPGSKGWRYEFDEKKTSRLILRSHDTAISPRTLSSKELEIPGKYFQISRCFRYDVIDATHNADFDQIGGFVVEENLNLRHLFGLLRLFAKEFCGTDEIKVVPAYFPFTEPSAGLYAKHPQMGWIELAGAGIFRPEMCRPLGVDKPVIAWGIGLGRVAMFKLGIKDIRQLYSHDLEYLRNAEVV